MIDSTEKKHLIIKVMAIVLIGLMVISILRMLLLQINILQGDSIYIYLTREMIFSILSSAFIVLCMYIMMKTEIQKINYKVLNLAFTDGLTGLYNRHYLNDFLEKFSSLRKEDANFSILFVDIDKFKEVNDNLGHKTGDCILKCLAESFKTLVRPNDILCRYGGEEFVIIFSDITKVDSLLKAEKIRSSIEKMRFNCEQKRITISIGMSFGSNGDEINEVMEEADSALYMAKDAGRNCVKVFGK